MGYLLVPRRTGPLDAPEFVLGAAEPVAAAQVSLLAVWLALGVRSAAAPWRLVGTWLVVAFWARLLRVLAAPNDWHFISTGLALTFVLEAAAIVAALGAARYAGFCLADDPADVRPGHAGPESFRFSLAALMLGTAALAFCLATSRLVIHYPLLGDAPLAFLRRLGPRAVGARRGGAGARLGRARLPAACGPAAHDRAGDHRRGPAPGDRPRRLVASPGHVARVAPVARGHAHRSGRGGGRAVGGAAGGTSDRARRATLMPRAATANSPVRGVPGAELITPFQG